MLAAVGSALRYAAALSFTVALALAVLLWFFVLAPTEEANDFPGTDWMSK